MVMNYGGSSRVACLWRLRRSVIRDDRRHDSRPSNVFRGIHVGMIGVSAVAAKKLALRLSVGFLDMPARRAVLAGVVGINHVETNAIQLAFVGGEEAKLGEAP